VFYFNTEPRLKRNKIILTCMFMRQLLQPIAAFVYCNRQAPPARATPTRPPAAGERRKFPACTTERARELRLFSKIILLQRAQCIASAVLATAIPSVCLSVRHTPVLCQNGGT